MKTYLTSAVAIAASMVASAAIAQTTPAPEAEAPGEDIIVTGTRLTGLKAADSPAPIQVLGADSLKRVGQTDLNQALAQQLPSIQAQAFGNDQTAFHPSIKLRGLNPNHTLILINGKRRHGTANVVVTNAIWTGGAAPDIGLIPGDAIDHVEVLQDGAAAQYGTDAIAGVVNFILKKNDHGGTINATAGQYMEGDGESWSVMAISASRRSRICTYRSAPNENSRTTVFAATWIRASWIRAKQGAPTRAPMGVGQFWLATRESRDS